MARQHYKLPPLTALAAFETSARHNSFKKAAEELGVTPGAVSHQIKSLEDDIGQLLFVRHYRGVEITNEGKSLFLVLQSSFYDISKTLDTIRKTEENNAVTISVSTAMSALWLTPRLTQFWKSQGQISVDQHVSDVFDPSRESPDLRIMYGYPRNKTPEIQADVLFRDDLVAVCSPGFYAMQKDIGLASIAKMPLIHLNSRDDRWTTWNEWFKNAGFTGKINEKVHVNNYMIALQTASDSAGVVLGWKKLLKPLLEKNELVVIGDSIMHSPTAFYLLSRQDHKLADDVQSLRSYLLNSFNQD